MEAIGQAVEYNPLSNFIPLFVALFLVHSGQFDLSDRCLAYFSVLHDPTPASCRCQDIANRFGVSRSTPYRSAARPESPVAALEAWVYISQKIA
jgi:hypothetical protein